MMPMICDNPKCDRHIPIPSSLADSPWCTMWGPVMPNGMQQQIAVDRFKYVNGERMEHRFYLFDTCHSAVEMVKKS